MLVEEALVEATGTDPVALLALADEQEDAGQSSLAQIRRLQYRLRTEASALSDQERKPLEAELIRLAMDSPVPVHEITNSIGMRLVQIPAGVGWIGSPEDEPGRYNDEGPRHLVRFDSFFLGVFQVTQEQYQEVMGNNPSYFKGDNLPVESVSWHDAAKFCQRLSELPAEKAAGRVYRLPHEKEWEYACRGNIDCHPYAFGDTLTPEMANFGGHKYGTTTVGSYRPNTFGLYDMHGNVWEWCANAYTQRYEGASEDDPFGSSVAGAGSSTARSADRRTATTNRQTAGPVSSASASSAPEGEQSGPFERSGEAAGSASARSASRRSAATTGRTTGTISSASASSAPEGEQGSPFGCAGAATGSTSTGSAGQPSATGSSRTTGTSSSDSASSASEGEDSVPFGQSGEATGATSPDTAGRRIAASTSLDAPAASSSVSAFSALEAVIRGGCAGGWDPRSAIRTWEFLGYGGSHIGFRILATNPATSIS